MQVFQLMQSQWLSLFIQYEANSRIFTTAREFGHH